MLKAFLPAGVASAMIDCLTLEVALSSLIVLPMLICTSVVGKAICKQFKLFFTKKKKKTKQT